MGIPGTWLELEQHIHEVLRTYPIFLCEFCKGLMERYYQCAPRRKLYPTFISRHGMVLDITWEIVL